MPFKSTSQARFMFARHPKIAERWAKETPDMKDLPPRVRLRKAIEEREKKRGK